MGISAGLRSVVVGMLFLINVPASAGVGPPIPEDKKLLVYGVNAVEAPYLLKHIATIEKWWPIDGIIVSVYPDDWKYRRTGQEGTYFGGHQYKQEDFKQTLTEMKATKFNRYTDNFLTLETCARGARYAGPEYGNLDWFDPNWSVIAENGAVIAWLAKEAGYKGIYLDIEFYPGSPTPTWAQLFNYSVRSDKGERSFQEVSAQARKRGREWMEAVTAAYPNISIMIQANTGWNAAGEEGETGLLPPFVDGLLEGAGPGVELSDAGAHAYWHQDYENLKGFVSGGKGTGTSLSAVPELFKKRIKHDLGICLDEDRNRPRGEDGSGLHVFYTKPNELNKNWRSPEALENTLYQALSATDRYVWIYLKHAPHFLNPGPVHPKGIILPWNICSQCPTAEKGETYGGWPQAYTEVLRNCRKPHDLSWNKFKTPEYYNVLAETFGGKSDAPSEERFRAALVKSIDADYICPYNPGGLAGRPVPLYVDENARLTSEGLEVTGSRGVEYDARAPLVIHWAGRYDYELTIEFWHKYEDGGRLLTIGRHSGEPTPLYQVMLISTDETGVKMGVWRIGDGNVVRAEYTFEKDKWYHIALVYDPNVPNPFGTKTDGITRLYINGEEVIAAQVKVELNPDWAKDAVIRVGGSVDEDVGIPAGSGKGVYADLIITRGLKYREKFTPLPRSSNK